MQWLSRIAIVAGCLIAALAIYANRLPRILNKPIVTIEHGMTPICAEVSPDGDEIVVSSAYSPQSDANFAKCRPAFWTLPSGAPSRRVEDPATFGAKILWTTIRQRLLLRDHESLRFLDSQTFVEQFRLPDPTAPNSSFEFSRDGKWLAAIMNPFLGSGVHLFSGDEVVLWNLAERTGPERVAIQDVMAIAFSADSQSLIYATPKDCWLLDLAKRTNEQLGSTPVSMDVADLHLQRNGDLLAILGSWGTLQIWDMSQRKMLRRLKAHDADGASSLGYSCRFLTSDEILVTASAGKSWQMPIPLRTPPYYYFPYTSHPEIKVWDVRTWKCLGTRRIEGQFAEVRAIPNSNQFLTIEDYKTIHLWNAR